MIAWGLIEDSGDRYMCPIGMEGEPVELKDLDVLVSPEGLLYRPHSFCTNVVWNKDSQNWESGPARERRTGGS